ncbi:MAG TPA: glycyl-radical enzyme activating protein, partial [Synergistaceae bacterium]|nr:glycyl-radical enzyme activating protein [Synergistaceae bacterium]
TGVDNGRILENIRRVGRLGVETVARVPLISGVNDDDENIRRTAAFVREALPSRKMELLPYHDFGRVKYVMLGMENLWHSFSTPSPERIAALEALIAAEGVEVVHYR